MVPATRCQMPDARCQMPDARCQMPDARCQIGNSGKFTAIYPRYFKFGPLGFSYCRWSPYFYSKIIFPGPRERKSARKFDGPEFCLNSHTLRMSTNFQDYPNALLGHKQVHGAQQENHWEVWLIFNGQIIWWKIRFEMIEIESHRSTSGDIDTRAVHDNGLISLIPISVWCK